MQPTLRSDVCSVDLQKARHLIVLLNHYQKTLTPYQRAINDDINLTAIGRAILSDSRDISRYLSRIKTYRSRTIYLVRVTSGNILHAGIGRKYLSLFTMHRRQDISIDFRYLVYIYLLMLAFLRRANLLSTKRSFCSHDRFMRQKREILSY